MLGEKIKKYRESKNMTQGEIADILGVKAATISKYEAGTLEPNIESLKRLADLFEVSVDELIKEDSFDISKINILESNGILFVSSQSLISIALGPRVSSLKLLNF